MMVRKQINKPFHSIMKGLVGLYTDVFTTTDYFPFGMVMPGRSYTSSGGEYRFGFNGMEKDGDLSGVDGGHLDFKYRIHDSRLGRFFSQDPLSSSYPWNSPYAFAENRVIEGIELEGAELLKNTSIKFWILKTPVLKGANEDDILSNIYIRIDDDLMRKNHFEYWYNKRMSGYGDINGDDSNPAEAYSVVQFKESISKMTKIKVKGYTRTNGTVVRPHTRNIPKTVLVDSEKTYQHTSQSDKNAAAGLSGIAEIIDNYKTFVWDLAAIKSQVYMRDIEIQQAADVVTLFSNALDIGIIPTEYMELAQIQELMQMTFSEDDFVTNTYNNTVEGLKKRAICKIFTG